jgi:three-Cys-motif partner protein
MEVTWETMGVIAETKAIDLWVLFPLGQAVNRLLTRKKPPSSAWADRLTLFFGSEDWQKEFYQKGTQLTLFGPMGKTEKNADYGRIGGYFVRRLNQIFAGVAENPLPLYNSRNVPIYLLCFAASNPKGAATAVRIAQDILGE